MHPLQTGPKALKDSSLISDPGISNQGRAEGLCRPCARKPKPQTRRQNPNPKPPTPTLNPRPHPFVRNAERRSNTSERWCASFRTQELEGFGCSIQGPTEIFEPCLGDSEVEVLALSVGDFCHPPESPGTGLRASRARCTRNNNRFFGFDGK